MVCPLLENVQQTKRQKKHTNERKFNFSIVNMPLHTNKCPGLKIAGQNLTAKFYGSKKDLKNWVKKVLCLLKTLKSKLNAVDERGVNYDQVTNYLDMVIFFLKKLLWGPRRP